MNAHKQNVYNSIRDLNEKKYFPTAMSYIVSITKSVWIDYQTDCGAILSILETFRRVLLGNRTNPFIRELSSINITENPIKNKYKIHCDFLLHSKLYSVFLFTALIIL